MHARLIARRHVLALGSSIAGTVLAGLISIGTSPDRWLPATFHDVTRDYAHAWAIADAMVIATSVAFALAAIIPPLLLMRRPRASKLTIEEGLVRAGAATLRAAEVSGFSVAPDGHGFSVAVGVGANTTFLEVDSLDDARRIATALRRRFPADGDLRLTLPLQSPALAVGMFSLVAVVYAVAFPLFRLADAPTAVLWLNGGLVSALLAALVVLRTRSPMELRWGASGTKAAGRRLDRSAIERHARRHLEGRLTADPAPPRIRVDVFARRDESVPAWLARIDALDRGDSYRGETAPRELLFETVADAHVPIDVRLAAARVLRVREHEPPERIAEAASDDDVRARIAAVTVDDADAAAAELEAIGPMFRARED